MSEAYGARRGGLGRLLPVPHRISYLIDPEGRVVRSYRVAKPGSHADRVLSDLRGLAGPGSSH